VHESANVARSPEMQMHNNVRNLAVAVFGRLRAINLTRMISTGVPFLIALYIL